MTALDDGFPLDYTSKWIDLGIVTRESIAEDSSEIAKGTDPHPEHYRWRAFKAFMDGLASMDGSLAEGLFQLGERDPDYSMGGSMMVAILYRSDCPSALLIRALQSDRRHIFRIARKRLHKTGEAQVQD